MPTLAQVNAVRPHKKKDFETAETNLFQNLARHPERFSGHSKVYHQLNDEEVPKDVTREQQPASVKLPQYRVDEELSRLGRLLGVHLDIETQVDRGNQEAKANVELPGGPTLRDVPVTTLLYWGKLLGRFHQVVSEMPVLEPGLKWNKDEATGLRVTDPIETRHTKKIRRFTVPIAPTEHQPGQYAEWDEDVRVGTWVNTQLSGALTRDDKTALLERIRLVQEAIHTAREKANTLTVTPTTQGTDLLKWLLAPISPAAS